MTNDSRGISTILNSKQNSPVSNISNRSATLDDSGNFVLRSGEHVLWKSFDYPSDVWLPNMKLGLFDLKSGNPRHKFLTSWLSPKVADLEAFMLGINPNNAKQLMSWKRGIVYWSSEIFNGKNFNCSAYVEFNFSYLSTENESYFTWNGGSKPFASYWIWLDSSGVLNFCYSAY